MGQAIRTFEDMRKLTFVSFVLVIALAAAACGSSDTPASSDAAVSSDAASSDAVSSDADSSDADSKTEPGPASSAPATAPEPTSTETPAPAETPVPAETPLPTSTETPAPEPTAAETPLESPELTIDGHLEWILASLDAGSAEGASERFSPDFLTQVPVQLLDSTFAQTGGGETVPWRIVSSDQSSDFEASAILGNSLGDEMRLDLVLEPDTGLISSALFRPVIKDAGLTEAEIDASLNEIAATPTLGVYDVTDESCDVIHELNPTVPAAIGSAFKLWVLAELGHQVAAGDAAWDEPLAVQTNLRSGPDGQVYQLADGDTLTLEEHAGWMISISDNTATDHLISKLGRENIEAALPTIGVADPALNTPFMSTGELFAIKFVPDYPNPSDWYEADETARRAILEELAAATLPWVEPLTPAEEMRLLVNADGVPTTDPRNLDIEWLATPRDMCETMLYLEQLADTAGLEPIVDILEANPGLPFDEEEWTKVRFKGGSEPGVLAGVWWLERVDGRQYVIAGMLNDAEQSFNQAAAIEAIAQAVTLTQR